MKTQLQAVRGMNDILPEQTPYWQFLEQAFSQTAKQHGYQEIRFPIVEKTELFHRSVGNNTDIVEKEMYTFTDLNGESLTLRPEGTAGCVRSVIEHSLCYNQTRRLYYIGPLFRHERPQKGRYRQFHQMGLEVYGIPTPDVEAELILLNYRLWQALGIDAKLELQINTLGDAQVRAKHKEDLVAFFSNCFDELDEDSKNRLNKNPLRILDSKNPMMQPLIAKAPKLADYLDEHSKAHFERLCQYLDTLDIPYRVNPRLVRGLDYYCHTVFEWVTTELGAQGTLCGGGRYDGLVEHMGGKPTAGVGCAMGVERILALMEICHTLPPLNQSPDVYLIPMAEEDVPAALNLAKQLCNDLPYLSAVTHCGGGNIKNKFKQADKSGSEFALVLGHNEIQTQTVTIKCLRREEEQRVMDYHGLLTFLQELRRS